MAKRPEIRPATGRPVTLRRRRGDEAEETAAQHLLALGWSVLARGIRVERDEIDLVCAEPTDPATLVFVEVRGRTSIAHGGPEETLSGAKITRIYRAAFRILRAGRLPDGRAVPSQQWRIDLITLDARPGREGPRLRHIRGIAPD